MSGEGLLELLALAEAATMRHDHVLAAQYFAQAVTLAPGNVTLRLSLANAYEMAGQHERRIEALRTAYEQGDRRDVAVAHALGAALLNAGEAVLSMHCFEAVRKQRPNDAAALAALAAAMRAAGEPARAWPLAKRAVQLSPATAPYLLTAAQIRHDLGDVAGAIAWIGKAEHARPQHAPTRFQRAISTLLLGASADGWTAFEQRPLPVPDTSAKAWNGEALCGESVLVTAEQGIGDQLQFLRFVSHLKERGAGRVVVEAHVGLVELLADNGYEVTPRGSAVATDLHVPLLSLPHGLALGSDVDGHAVPYLRTVSGNRASSTTSKPELPDRAPGALRLGVVWAGNPVFPGRATRDLDPATLPQLLAIPAVTWISLQQGSAGNISMPGLHILPPLTDWRTSAQLLTELDGLVTTDTGIAHLAGAMGIRTWVLLQKVPDWRWGLLGDTTPWYPSVTLLRQTRDRDWPGVIHALSTLLAEIKR